MNKKLLALLLALMMVLACFAACGGDTEEPVTEDGEGGGEEAGPAVDIGEIAYVSYYTTIPYWNDGLRGLEAAAEDLGLSFDRSSNFYGPTDGSSSEQARIIDELVAKGVSGLIVSPIDGDGILSACENAMNNGIPVVTVISGMNDTSTYYGSLGASNHEVGVTGGTYAAELIGGEGQVGILTIPGVPVHDERSGGYTDTFAEYPGIEVLPLVNTDADPETGLQRASALIQANPDLKVLIGTDSVGGAAAARAVMEADKVGEIFIIGMDRDEDLLGYIKDGVVTASVASRSYTTKYMAMHYIYWILTDAMEDVGLGIGNMSAGIPPVPPVTDTGTMLITADNVDLFLDALE
ncbi:MAG: substrate-binding domain-containing protein [Bacillota bacterium]|nr:substrate-binding domain-containing protein [Bacillota bacterium]